MAFTDKNKYFPTLREAQKFAHRKREDGYKTRIIESRERTWRVDYGVSLSFGSTEVDNKREITEE